MRNYLLLILLIAAVSGCKTEKPASVTEENITGSWECVSGCDAEYYVFEKSDTGRDFYTYSGQRMYQSGSWMLDPGMITLHYMAGDSDVFAVELRNDSLFFDSGRIIFKRFIEKQEKTDSTKVSAGKTDDNLLSGLIGLTFSQPEPKTFEWSVSPDSVSKITHSISGKEIKTMVMLSGDFTPPSEALQEIANHLIGQLGYSPEEMMVSNTCSGFVKETMVVLVCSDSNDKKAVITVQWGLMGE